MKRTLLGESKRTAITSAATINLHGNQPKPFAALPGPRPSLPFFGTSWSNYFRPGKSSLFELHEIFLDRYRRYGPIVREEFQWRRPVVHLFNANDIETAFRYQGTCPIRPPNEFVRKYRSDNPQLYNGVGLSNALGQEWYNTRTALAPVLTSMKTLHRRYYNRQQTICNDYCDYLEATRNHGKVINDLQATLYRLAIECKRLIDCVDIAIFMLCLDERLGCLECGSLNSDAVAVIDATIRLFESYQQLYYGSVAWWKYIETKAYRKYVQAESELYKITQKHLKACRESVKSSQENGSVLEALLNSKNLSEKDIQLTILDFIAGGVFTMTSSMTYLLFHLAKNHVVQEKLYEELKKVNFEGTNCSYLKACLKESFRLSPAVPGIMRILPNQVFLSGYQIPAHTPVFANTLVTSRLSEYFPDPDTFRPERWLGSERPHPFSMLPFGFGARMCAGRNFAQLELITTAAKMVQRFRMKTTDELQQRFVFVIVPNNPIKITLENRPE